MLLSKSRGLLLEKGRKNESIRKGSDWHFCAFFNHKPSRHHFWRQYFSWSSSVVVLTSGAGGQWLIQFPGLTWGPPWKVRHSKHIFFLSPESLIFTYLAYISRASAANTSARLVYFSSKDKFRMVDNQMDQWIKTHLINKHISSIYANGLSVFTCPL